MAFFLIAALLFVPFGSSATASVDFEKEDPTGGAMFADFILVRPVGIVALVAGSVLFVISKIYLYTTPGRILAFLLDL